MSLRRPLSFTGATGSGDLFPQASLREKKESVRMQPSSVSHQLAAPHHESAGGGRQLVVLLLARGVQGIGAALTLPSALSILTTTFVEGPKRNQAMGIYVATAASGFSFGLILGGLLTTFLSWHWVFYVNVPFALLILLLGPVMIKESHSQLGSRSYDLAGAITVTAGVLLLVYAITQTTQSSAS